jgi:FkbM family methyltransferase
MQNALLKMYSLVNRSGVLNTPVCDYLFRKSYFLYKQVCEDNLQAYCRSHAQQLRSGHILDIGANIGYTASVLARYTDPQYSVFAFEPEAHNFERLERLIHARRLNSVQAFRYAVGDQDGEISLWENADHHADHRVCTDAFSPKGQKTQQVPLVAIDSFLEKQGCPEPIAFAKIDVQGFELAVLKGMQRTIQLNPQLRILFEYHPPSLEALGFSADSLLEFFVLNGFSLFFVEKSGKLRIAEKQTIAEKLKTVPYMDLLAMREGNA